MQSKYFQLGRLMITTNASRVLKQQDVFDALRQHAQCDWGDVCHDDWVMNDEAVKNGDRLVSVYHDSNKEKFYIITEADRSATTVLLPEDY